MDKSEFDFLFKDSSETDVKDDSENNSETENITEETFEIQKIENNEVRIDKRTAKRSVIVACVLGFICIIVILFIYSRFQGVSSNEKSVGNDVSDGNYSNKYTNISNLGHKDWVLLGKSTLGNVSDKINSIFTIIGIEHYVRTDSLGSQVKSVVKGNIAGLKGEYEIYLNFSLASKLKEGNAFNIQYTTLYENGETYIIDIWWE